MDALLHQDLHLEIEVKSGDTWDKQLLMLMHGQLTNVIPLAQTVNGRKREDAVCVVIQADRCGRPAPLKKGPEDRAPSRARYCSNL